MGENASESVLFLVKQTKLNTFAKSSKILVKIILYIYINTCFIASYANQMRLHLIKNEVILLLFLLLRSA